MKLSGIDESEFKTKVPESVTAGRASFIQLKEKRGTDILNHKAAPLGGEEGPSI